MYRDDESVGPGAQQASIGGSTNVWPRVFCTQTGSVRCNGDGWCLPRIAQRPWTNGQAVEVRSAPHDASPSWDWNKRRWIGCAMSLRG
jgi:hypothetical protein